VAVVQQDRPPPGKVQLGQNRGALGDAVSSLKGDLGPARFRGSKERVQVFRPGESVGGPRGPELD
jgi:hypothetical protein